MTLSIAAVAWGGFLAGIVARRRGMLAAILANLPASLLWGIAGILGLFSKSFLSYEISLPNSILALILFLVIPVVSLKAGSHGSIFGCEYGEHFDSRPKTLFGIKWFHFIWMSPAINIIAAQTSWAFINVLLLSTSILGWILAGALYATIFLTITGMMRAYLLLSGLESAQKSFGVAVLKFGCGWPMLAMILQTVIMGIIYGLSKIF